MVVGEHGKMVSMTQKERRVCTTERKSKKLMFCRRKCWHRSKNYGNGIMFAREME